MFGTRKDAECVVIPKGKSSISTTSFGEEHTINIRIADTSKSPEVVVVNFNMGMEDFYSMTRHFVRIYYDAMRDSTISNMKFSSALHKVWFEDMISRVSESQKLTHAEAPSETKES